MAAPITHIVLTEKIFDQFFKNKTNKIFFVGSLFPDIRYLKVVDRSKTHFENLIVADLENSESFLAGVKFHSILDIAREKFIVANNTYSLCPESKYVTQSLKFLEDEIFYQHVQDWQKYIGYFNEVLPEETGLGVDSRDAEKWHLLLQQYFKKQPDRQAVADFVLGVGFPDEAALEINENIAKMKVNKKIINILENLYQSFGSMIG